MNSPIKKGDRVVLISGRYTPELYNPRVGSNYFCEGTVYELGSYYLKVLWDNGSRNSYRNGDLYLTCESRISSCKSIW